LLALAALLLAPLIQAGDAVKARQLMTLMRADEVVAGAMKSGLANGKTGVGLSIAQIGCLNAVPPAEFSDAVTKAIADGLSNQELAAALAFYRTAAGANYVKSIVALTQANVRPVPLNDADAASVRDFAASPAGDKLLRQAMIPNSDVVADRMAEVSTRAIETCARAAGK
jgi:hypothetical protein